MLVMIIIEKLRT